MKKVNRVIAVGFDQRERLSDLVADLKAHGFELTEIPTADALTPVLEQGDCAVILVYKDPDIDVTRQVLNIVGDAAHTPVIVLVDRAEVEEYFELMCARAFDYFELLHGPELIERSVEHAACAAA